MDQLPDDLLVYLFALLDIPEILRLRQVCKRIHAISCLRIVWTNACIHRVLAHNYPFFDGDTFDLTDVSIPDLERRTRRAYTLATRWLSPDPPSPSVLCEFDATNGTPIYDLRFVPGREGKWVIVVSKQIWSILSLWEVDVHARPARKLFEWSRRGGIIHNLVLSDTSQDPLLAVSFHAEKNQVEVMTIHKNSGFISLCTIDTKTHPGLHTINTSLNHLYLQGDLLVLADDMYLSVLMNWKTGASVILRRAQESGTGIPISDNFIQAVINPAGILIVRGRSISLFPHPILSDPPTVQAPIAIHCYEWVDDIAVAPISSSSLTSAPSQAILIRPELDDPWAPINDVNAYALDLSILESTSTQGYTYSFPPTHLYRIPSARGHLPCGTLRLGRHGTAVWIEPRDMSSAGLVADAYVVGAPEWLRRQERLVGAVFRGGPGSGEMGMGIRAPANGDSELGTTHSRILRLNEPLSNWRALDYLEVAGLVGLGDGRGRVVILDLAGTK
ncbi:hypothetical protein FB45DRAFT_340337 [Roridomyces roridus]|uniref:F-box domain-containing protein n=1 Tax=Roridomyces roridus TaxID=1738132 RepID=A0AAD7B4Q8_9AGAR|nr:hypothetical protein FB45DRAFT_340337 [Roridomyces roridus]